MNRWLDRATFGIFHDVRMDVPVTPPHKCQWEAIQVGNPVRATLSLWGCPNCRRVICTRPGTDPYDWHE
jgi:hypothetical protein